MCVEPLQLVPEKCWSQLVLSLKLDWPRSIYVVNLLEALKRLPDLRRKFDYKIYCPYGNITFGMVAACTEIPHNEVIIHCSSELETFLKAVKSSKIINWDVAVVHFTDRRVKESVAVTMRTRGVERWLLESSNTIYMDTNPFDVRLPEDVRYGLLSVNHVKQIDSTWVHQYIGSEWYFEQLIKSNLGYGLFEKAFNNLIAWCFYTESGTFDYMCVIDSYRRKGYGGMLTKICYNSIHRDKQYMSSFCVRGNGVALKLFNKLGYKVIGKVFCTIFKCKMLSKI